LEFADPKKYQPAELRTTILIFSLVASETRGLLDFLRREVRRLELAPTLQESIEGFIYCIPLELRKVIDTELTDISSFKRTETVYTSIENSHGILRDSYQQSVVQLAQVFEPSVDGKRIFAEYDTKLEQSLALRRDMIRLIRAVHYFARGGDPESADQFKEMVSTFNDHSLRYLMYRDWANFETFNSEIERCDSIGGLVQIAHRFETYLRTLLREVSKRGVLQGIEWEKEQDTLPGSLNA
jgi:hypothetical protein